MAKSRKIALETRTFEKVGDAKAFFSGILRRYPFATPIPEPDETELKALLKRHDDYLEKVGSGISHFEVNSPPSEYPPHTDRCFWIVRNDDTKVDFSIGHCLEKKPND